MNSLLLHAGFTIYHAIVWKGLIDVTEQASRNGQLSPVTDLSTRLMTNWNFALQTIFFFTYLLVDILLAMELFQNFADKLKRNLDFCFYSIIGPMGVFVPTVFWGLWTYDKGLLNVFPEAAIDQVLPPWVNHAVHTVVLINVIVQAYHNEETKYEKVKNMLIPLTLFNSVYICCVYLTYYEKRIWVYGFLRKLNEPYKFMSLLSLLAYSILLGIGFNYVNHLYCDSRSKHKRKCT